MAYVHTLMYIIIGVHKNKFRFGAGNIVLHNVIFIIIIIFSFIFIFTNFQKAVLFAMIRSEPVVGVWLLTPSV